jgi:hypothetical protein
LFFLLQKTVSAAEAKICDIHFSGAPLQIIDSNEPILACCYSDDSGNEFPAAIRTNYLEVCQFPLSANDGKPIAATNHRAGFQKEMQGNYQP